MSSGPNIDLYTAGTPNGIKISMTLEELGLPYKVHSIDLGKNTQKEPWFLEINPNGRIPCITDTFSDGKKIRLFESGGIMQYLVATYDKDHKISYPPGTREFFETNNWLFFQNAGIGPMQGQANHFSHYAPEPIPYGINRYTNEARRLYSVLDKHLRESKQDYLAGNKCTIADIAHWGWIASAGWTGIEIDEFPTLKAWEDRMAARPGISKGKDVPDKFGLKEILNDPQKMKEIKEEHKVWIQKGMQNIAQK